MVLLLDSMTTVVPPARKPSIRKGFAMHRCFASSLAFAAACAVASPAQAAFFANASGLAAPDRTITFEEVALTNNQSVTTQFAGVTFSGAWANPDTSSTYPNITGNRIGNFAISGSVAGELVMDFATPVDAVAFSMVTALGASNFSVFRSGVLVETAVQPTTFTEATNFYGFTGIVFDRLSVTVDSFDHALLLDNLQISAVPEPQTGALMLAGAGFLAFGMRRRRRGDKH